MVFPSTLGRVFYVILACSCDVDILDYCVIIYLSIAWKVI